MEHSWLVLACTFNGGVIVFCVSYDLFSVQVLKKHLSMIFFFLFFLGKPSILAKQ